MKEFTPIQSSRLLLRPFKESDLDAFVAYRADPEVARYQSWESYTREEGIAFFESMAKARFNAPGEYFQIAFERKDTNEMIGDCVVHPLAEDARQVEIGFTLAKRFQGKGYAHEALTTLLTYLFDELKKHRAFAVTDVKNEGSIKLLENLGMRREGHFIENIWFKGEWGSEYLYAILNKEWKR
ncbi:GNAT family N-acetyltransferase [Guptibacillus algicola]|uniref:GNAT family N-acetyltransferase n=1 Tax=Guptibacillus algicola TaxID=225844 RepID=UPI001CD5C558|nr:GNAT family N-acetyltransferase [Alkalihalobacillus algicola]MCA0987471.1 GNAT family N-acetyltransferase [Alkalihalobacillus algicola]